MDRRPPPRTQLGARLRTHPVRGLRSVDAERLPLDRLWRVILRRAAHRIPAEEVTADLAPLRPLTLDPAELVLEAPSAEAVERFRLHLGSIYAATAEVIGPRKLTVQPRTG